MKAARNIYLKRVEPIATSSSGFCMPAAWDLSESRPWCARRHGGFLHIFVPARERFLDIHFYTWNFRERINVLRLSRNIPTNVKRAATYFRHFCNVCLYRTLVHRYLESRWEIFWRIISRISIYMFLFRGSISRGSLSKIDDGRIVKSSQTTKIGGTSIAVSINEPWGGGWLGRQGGLYVERGPADQQKPELLWFCRSVPGRQP